MKIALNILIVEDSVDDAELLVEALRSAGYESKWQRVETEQDYRSRLGPDVDLIFSDFSLPQFSTRCALQVLQATRLDIPFIIVSGTIGEERAAETMKAGATDYLLKDRLGRLGSAVAGALEQRRLREERRRTQQQVMLQATALEAAANGILITDTSGAIQWVNPAFTTATGYTGEEVIGKTPRVLKSGRHGPEFYRDMWQTILAGGTWRGEFINRRKDGSLYYDEHTIAPVRAADGSITHFVGVFNDVTSRKQSEEALARSEAELRWKTAFLEAQVNSSLDGILVVDDQGRKILQNRRMTELWKIPPEIAAAIDDETQLAFVTRRVRAPERFVARLDYIRSHPNETSRDEIVLDDGMVLDRYSASVVGKDGTGYGRIWTFRDITEKKQLESQLREAQKMEAFGQLAGGVAHDFNNMLAVIQGNTELVMASGQTSTETTEYLRDMMSALARAASLTRQLLIFSRRQAMHPQPVMLDRLVKDLIKMLRRVIREDISLECQSENELPCVHADPGMIEQVLLNLVVNARDAMPRGGQMQIVTEKVSLDVARAQMNPQAQAGVHVCLSVSDTGTGIAPEHVKRIFEPFFTTKELGKGTGLGLATAYGIVKQHEGWIEVFSEVGRGTTFKVFFPVSPTPASGLAITPLAAELRGGVETILIVEDDLAVRLTTRRILESRGYRIYEAASAREALDLWREHAAEIALLLSDMLMPEGITGRDLAEQLRVHKAELKVILMSGYSTEAVGIDTDLFRQTKTCFLPKPCELSALLQTVRQCLDETELSAFES